MRPVKRDMDYGILAALWDCNPVEVTTSESIEVQVYQTVYCISSYTTLLDQGSFVQVSCRGKWKEAEKLWGS